MLLRDDNEFFCRPAQKRDRGPLGTRCAEGQADGVPCPDPDCDCDHCARAFPQGKPYASAAVDAANRPPHGPTHHA